MSYDLSTFTLVPGQDPGEVVDELLEAFDEELPEAERPAAAAAVAGLVKAFQAEFPEADIEVRRDGTYAEFLLDEGLISVDVHPKHCDVAISYGMPKEGEWVIDRISRLERAAFAGAGHDAIFDQQLGAVIDPPRDAPQITEKYRRGLEIVAELADEYAAEAEAEQAKGGFFKRLFGKG